jgi:hypothetical protein
MISTVVFGRWAIEIAYWPTLRNANMAAALRLPPASFRFLATLSEVARWLASHRGSVVGNSTIHISAQAKPKTDGSKICGAMAQQHGAGGHHETESVPQKFVHLVGCRDPNARKTPTAPPRPMPKKP